jgi:hypothetical protein
MGWSTLMVLKPVVLMDLQTKSYCSISMVTNAMQTRDLDRAPVQPSW